MELKFIVAVLLGLVVWSGSSMADKKKKPFIDSYCHEKTPHTVECGGYTYATEHDRQCCALRYSRLGEKVYVMNSKCVGNYTDSAIEKCGFHDYDFRIEGCCGNHVYNRSTSKCCTNSTTSSVVSLETTCCSGTPMQAGEMCCSTSNDCRSVKPKQTTHRHCCLNPDTDTIQTYRNGSHYCDGNGEVRKKPTIPPSRLPMLRHVDGWRKAKGKCGRGRRSQDGAADDSKSCCRGQQLNPDTHYCCGGTPLNRNDGVMSCCKGRPFYRQVMQCTRKTGGLKAKNRGLKKNKPVDMVCTKGLLTWDQRWPAFKDPRMMYIRAKVEPCELNLTSSTLSLSLNPALPLSGGSTLSRCLQNGRLQLVMQLPENGNCLRQSDIREYLRGNTLEIFFRRKRMIDCTPDVPVLTLAYKDRALVLLSHKIDTMLRDQALFLLRL